MGNTFIGDWGGWENKMKFLLNGRKRWAKRVFEAAKGEKEFEEIKRTSPFADKVVVAVRYGIGTIFYGDIYALADANGGVDIASSIIKNAIRSNGWATHSSDDYLLVFNKLKSRDNDSVEIFWIGSGNQEAKSSESAK